MYPLPLFQSRNWFLQTEKELQRGGGDSNILEATCRFMKGKSKTSKKICLCVCCKSNQLVQSSHPQLGKVQQRKMIFWPIQSVIQYAKKVSKTIFVLIKNSPRQAQFYVCCRTLLMRLIFIVVFSKCAKFYQASSPYALIFFRRILLMRSYSFSAFL